MSLLAQNDLFNSVPSSSNPSQNQSLNFAKKKGKQTRQKRSSQVINFSAAAPKPKNTGNFASKVVGSVKSSQNKSLLSHTSSKLSLGNHFMSGSQQQLKLPIPAAAPKKVILTMNKNSQRPKTALRKGVANPADQRDEVFF